MIFNDIYNKALSILAPNKVNTGRFINKQQLYRYEQQINQYKQALQAAESIYSPNRFPLYQVYNNINLDAHLSSVAESRKVKVLAHQFKITRNGTDDDKATALFKNKKWFNDFLELAQESILYGYSLIEFEGFTDGEVSGIHLVPREHVKPAQHLVVTNPGDTSGLDYTSTPYSEWLLGVGREQDLGLLAKVAPLVILKQNVTSNWAQFTHLFGMPLRVAKTNLSDPDRAAALYKMLQDMSSAAFAVVDSTDVIEMGEAIQGDGVLFEKFNRWVDEQISKVLLGGTMNSDNGSSRAQGEVHERLADTYAEYDLRNITFAINDKLIPLLIKHGYDLTNCTFQFFESEDIQALFTMTKEFLSLGLYEIEDDKWFENKFNIPLKKLATPAPQPQAKDTGNFQQPE